MGGRTITLFSKYVLIAQSPDGEKSYYLEPLTHRFPFVITIPTAKECSVPSTLEVSKTLFISFDFSNGSPREALYSSLFTHFFRFFLDC